MTENDYSNATEATPRQHRTARTEIAPLYHGTLQTELYRHFDADGQLLYVGISYRMPGRTNEHARRSSWFAKVARTTTETFPNKRAAMDAELRAIKTERPIYNRMGNGKCQP